MLDQFRACLLGLAHAEAHVALRARVRPQDGHNATLLMLCTLESYCECGHLDPFDIADRMVTVSRVSRLGNAVRPGTDQATWRACELLEQGYSFERAAQLAASKLGPNQRSGAACLARVLPIGLLRYHEDARIVGESRVVCSITHAHETAKLACSTLGLAVAHLLMVGSDGLQEELLEFTHPRSQLLTESLIAIPRLQPRDLHCDGDAVSALQCALWAATYCDDVDESQGLLQNVAGDPTAPCSIGAALLGARLGLPALRSSASLDLREARRIEIGAARLYEMAIQG